jgi:hypothetical protein
MSANQLYPGGDMLRYMRSFRTGHAERDRAQALRMLRPKKATNTSHDDMFGNEGSGSSGRRRLSAFTELTPAQIKYNACPVIVDLSAFEGMHA